MKRNLIVALMLGALSLLTATISFAQDKGSFDIPFAFQVGKASLPAGTYTVSEVAYHSIVIRNCQQASKAALINYRNDQKSKTQSPNLVFHKYGQKYFLAEGWDGGNWGMQLHESELEKEMHPIN